MAATASEWDARYKDSLTPWDTGRVDLHLLDYMGKSGVRPDRVLEIGCGKGTNVLWMAGEGMHAVGVDISEVAIETAREKARKDNISAGFYALDFLSRELQEHPFDFVFDRGCFHSFPSQKERITFAKHVSRNLCFHGCWLSIIGSADDPPRETGPPMRSATEIVTAVEPYFRILSLTASRFDSNKSVPPGCWCLFARKRNSNVQSHKQTG